mmetsp:Transcript_25984/g.32032  ORF Transcript_25984/g.32032 Transcript_25984/m.32032 type:complete len:363 (+) Transcript_25984:146-1234(+)
MTRYASFRAISCFTIQSSFVSGSLLLLVASSLKFDRRSQPIDDVLSPIARIHESRGILPASRTHLMDEIASLKQQLEEKTKQNMVRKIMNSTNLSYDILNSAICKDNIKSCVKNIIFPMGNKMAELDELRQINLEDENNKVMMKSVMEYLVKSDLNDDDDQQEYWYNICPHVANYMREERNNKINMMKAWVQNGAGHTSRRSGTATPELKWSPTYKNDVKALLTIFNGTNKDIGDLVEKEDKLKLYYLFISDFASLVTGKNKFKSKRRIEYYNQIVTPSDEAFAMLLLKNNSQRYLDMIDNPYDADKWALPLYSMNLNTRYNNKKQNYISSVKRGWNVDGKLRYVEFWQHVLFVRQNITSLP